jgi:hypothetical protein
MSNCFISIVNDKDRPGFVKVRARKRSHLKAIFPRAKIIESKDSDYRFRTILPRESVAATIFDRIISIDYDNFKNSVKDDRLHSMYALWWQDHYRYQHEDDEARPRRTAPK